MFYWRPGRKALKASCNMSWSISGFRLRLVVCHEEAELLEVYYSQSVEMKTIKPCIKLQFSSFFFELYANEKMKFTCTCNAWKKNLGRILPCLKGKLSLQDLLISTRTTNEQVAMLKQTAPQKKKSAAECKWKHYRLYTPTAAVAIVSESHMCLSLHILTPFNFFFQNYFSHLKFQVWVKMENQLNSGLGSQVLTRDKGRGVFASYLEELVCSSWLMSKG